MKDLNFTHAVLSSIVVYLIGILAFVGSHFIPVLEDPDLQANIVLMAVIIPAAYLGAILYYRRGHTTHGLILGTAMFTGAILLDAVITVPVFIIPNGGDHFSFFGDPGFWLIGLEYVAVVVAFWQLRLAKNSA